MIIDKSSLKECRKCKGIGHFGYMGNDHDLDICLVCNGTGTYKDEHYIIVANGIAIDSDMRGK